LDVFHFYRRRRLSRSFALYRNASAIRTFGTLRRGKTFFPKSASENRAESPETRSRVCRRQFRGPARRFPGIRLNRTAKTAHRDASPRVDDVHIVNNTFRGCVARTTVMRAPKYLHDIILS